MYGNGRNVRDWLYVGDHCSALRTVLRAGVPVGTYNIGGKSERSNLEVVHAVCGLLDEMLPTNEPRRDLIEFVKDRPGHDCRYAIDSSRLSSRLGWIPRETFESGLRKTVEWYLKNRDWTEQVRCGAYQQWITLNYEQRGNLCCPS